MDSLLALVIEDDEDLSAIFAEALQAAGYEAEIVRDGRQALERLAQTKPHLVVLDLHLPHVEGTSILAQIRNDQRLAQTRVVVATADSRMAEMTRKKADLVLIKPISFSLLRDLTARFKSIASPNQ
jgi:two-component system cell cycle response regulator DivK